MNTIEYEVESMSGLMPQILALTAPPGTRELSRPTHNQPCISTGNGQAINGTQQNLDGAHPSKSSEAGLAAHPYFKRPGRGHNHDSCDSCGEGGDLICCDLCPASFHLTCHDPPLDENEIPIGEWACHQCRMGGNDNTSNSCSRSIKSLKNGGKTMKTKENDDYDGKVFAGGRELEISKTPLTTLIKAAAVVNPKEFMLPLELTLPANFPGEPKELTKKNGSRRGCPKKKPYELDNGLVPLPAKLCFQCSKSCRIGPLIPCDYCPLLWHLDCLDPPLTVPPMGRWMCPTHPEHIMDTYRLMSHSLTERVRLWDKFTTPVDQNSVKLNFLQRCHRMNPPFRYKIKKALRSRMRVPSSIKGHYKDPPDLLPHLSSSHYIPVPPPVDDSPLPNSSPLDAPPLSSLNLMATSASALPGSDCRNDTTSNIVNGHQPPKEEATMEESLAAPCDEGALLDDRGINQSQGGEEGEGTIEQMDVDSLPTKDEKEQWLSSLLSLHSSIMKHMTNTGSKGVNNNLQCNGPTELPAQVHNLESKPSCLNGDVVSHESRMNKLCLDGKKTSNSLIDGFFQDSQGPIYYSGSKKSILKAHKGKILSTPILKSSKHKKSSSQLLMDVLSSLSLSLKEKMEDKHDVCLSSLDRTIIDILAYERLDQIMSPSAEEPIISNPLLPARALLCPLLPDIKLKDLAPKKKYSKNPIPMMFRILTIGKGSHNHVNLDEFGLCNYISSHHASIMFDECTGVYELLNYSEYGTKVDGVSYDSNFSEKTVSQAAPPPFLQQVKAIIAQKRGLRLCDRMPSPPPAMNSCPGKDMVRCQCRQRRPFSNKTYNAESQYDVNLPNETNETLSGWEGAAVIHHGSYIRFGCLQFLFSIVEEASKGNWADDTLTTYERFVKKDKEERARDLEEKHEQEEEEEEDDDNDDEQDLDKDKEKKTKKEESSKS